MSFIWYNVFVLKKGYDLEMNFKLTFKETQRYSHYISIKECTFKQYNEFTDRLQELQDKNQLYDNNDSSNVGGTTIYGTSPEQVEEILDDLGIKYTTFINNYQDPESIHVNIFMGCLHDDASDWKPAAEWKSDIASDNEPVEPVAKPKKYYIHFDLSQPDGYLHKYVENNKDVYYFLAGKEQKLGCQTEFTKDEIAKIPPEIFKITDVALEEVKGDDD